ncbi:hypothetical protein K439DRAFT_1180838 [Ramaria rubella]|nr:hypothetical protein K439DRAFT_1180838 [Ramaria rubella]
MSLTRIYLLEDSVTKKLKRKLVDIDDDSERVKEDVGVENTDLPHRPNALLLQGPPITQIPTARVFAYATYFDAHPIGLEWVDDQTCVLVFASRKSALEAWDVLRKSSQPIYAAFNDKLDATDVTVDSLDEAFYPAHALPLALYPIEERINSVLGKKSDALKEVIQIRWARGTDVKERGARVRSEFYKRHGEMAGKEGLPDILGSRGHEEGRNGAKRRKRDNDEEMKRQLDAELDVFLVGDSHSTSRGEPQANKTRRPEDRLQVQEEKRRILDYELDSFLARGGDIEDADLLNNAGEEGKEGSATAQGPSLLERTTGTTSRSRSPRDHTRQVRSLPRRARRGGQDSITRYETDADGRWLHNEEVTQRRRNDGFDEDGFGMRAWSNERDQSRRSKLRKTQEELDRELDRLWQEPK